MTVRRNLIYAIDIPVVAASFLLAFLLRFDFQIPRTELVNLYAGIAIFVACKTPFYYLLERRRRLWNFVGVRDLVPICATGVLASATASAVTWIALGGVFPRSIYFIDLIICTGATSAVVCSPRLLQEFTSQRYASANDAKQVLVYGAGAAGLILAKEITYNPKLAMRVAGFLDDDPAKVGASLAAVPVLSSGYYAAQLVRSFARCSCPISEIIVAIPSADQRQMREIIANCRSAGVPFRTVPSLTELLEGKTLSGQIRDVSVDDLLGRDPVRVSEDAIGQSIDGKVVMVTGGCGSIGSELCRQLPRFGPRKLVIFDQAESAMFMLALELRERFPALELVTEIGDVVSYPRLNEAITRNRVQAVFHAAAYKHVPLMEAHVLEAAKNNVYGTYNVVRAAQANGIERFLMISSDKAVNPTSIMGVTKRIGELIVSGLNSQANRKGTYVSVRFGNVLASSGSVVEIFRRQIAAGGPVTVTDPNMRRYFMSIPEAVQLVLQAFAMGNGGEIFVLDMGQPVHITELAENMIRLAGYTPGEQVKIEYTGLRPGEKLFEEINTDSEDMQPTYHEKIKIFRSSIPNSHDINTWIATLQSLLETGDAAAVKEHLIGLVPEYLGPQPKLTHQAAQQELVRVCA